MNRWKTAFIFAGAFTIYFVTCGRGLDEWDAVQFAMGTRRFDLWHPQQPGYPLFIFSGWLWQRLIHFYASSLQDVDPVFRDPT